MKITKTFLLVAFLFAGAIGLNAQDEADQGKKSTAPECEKELSEDSAKKSREYISLYREEFKRGNYMASIPFWRKAYNIAPCYREFITTNGSYLMGLLIAKTKQETPTDTAKIRKYADTLIKLYEDRLRFFGENYSVTGNMGSDIFTYYPNRRLEAIGLMKQSLENKKIETDPTVLTNLILAATQENRAKGKITAEDVIQLFEDISVVVDHNIKSYKEQYKASPAGDSARVGQNLRYWEWVENYVVAVVTPYLTCDKLTEIYTPKFKADPSNKELVEKIITLLKRSPNCAKTSFYLSVAEKNLELNPSADAAAALAKAFQEKGNLGKAKGFYDKAAELEDDNSKKAAYYLVLAGIELSERSCAQARTYARKVLEINPNSGDAYIIIGNAYMQCASNCGGDAVEKSYPFLAAYDKFLKAKTVDPSVASKASSYMITAQARWPKVEDIFFKENLNVGDMVNTGCWIGETTQLRGNK